MQHIRTWISFNSGTGLLIFLLEWLLRHRR